MPAYFKNDILVGNIRPYLKKIWFADCFGGTNGDVLVIHLTNKELDLFEIEQNKFEKLSKLTVYQQ